MFNSFLILSRKLITDNHFRNKIDNDGLVTYMLLGDRIKVSTKNHWIDHRNAQYYCYYPVNDLAHDARVGRTKMFQILKTFKNLGLISTERNPNGRSNRIFLPKFIWRTSRSSDSERVCSNNKSSNNKHTCNTSHTARSARKEKLANKSKTKKLEAKARSAKRHEKLNAAITNQLVKTTAKRTQLAPEVVDEFKFAAFNNPRNFYHYVSLLLRAKKSVINNYRHNPKTSVWKFNLVRFGLTFELNDYFTLGAKAFASNVHRILVTALRNIDGKIKNASGYIMRSFKNLFKGAVTSYINEYKELHHIGGPRIPIFRI